VSAPFGSRVVAKVLDGLGVVAIMCPTAWLISRLAEPWWRPIIMICVGLIGGSVVFGVYTMMAEYRRGQTLGKRLQGIRAVSETGARLSLGQAIVRQLPMFLQVFWIDAMFALFTDKSQRAFEMLSKTRVVRA
jgi:uncharacterized RDD family membrane protein YckC